jgi:hypothetical protein
VDFFQKFEGEGEAEGEESESISDLTVGGTTYATPGATIERTAEKSVTLSDLPADARQAIMAIAPQAGKATLDYTTAAGQTFRLTKGWIYGGPVGCWADRARAEAEEARNPGAVYVEGDIVER